MISGLSVSWFSKFAPHPALVELAPSWCPKLQLLRELLPNAALFGVLCRRYGLSPYRIHRQRRNTVMVRAPRGFVDQVLWPEFVELDRVLQAYLREVTLRVIRDEVFADASEAQEVPEALPPN